MRKTIVIFSNPFGYGPTGTIMPVLRNLLGQVKDADVIFAGSGLCLEIISGAPIKIEHLNERDEVEIENYLKTLSNVYVIGSQNRFCIKVAKKLHIPCAFIDVLAWFWKEIPADHFLADEIFWIKFPQVENRIPKNMRNIHLVSSIISTTSGGLNGNQLMVHIGGAKYPLMNHLPHNYLNLIAKGLNSFKIGEPFKKVMVVGGSEAINYLSQKVTIKDIFLCSLPQEKFTKELEKSSHLLTTAGVSSTLESFSLNVPTSFLLPLNLSQIALTKVLEKNGAYIQGLEWQKYLKINNNLRNISEKEALVEIDNYARIIDENEELSKQFVDDFLAIAKSIPNNEGQRKIIEYMGDLGGKEVVDILIKKWDLS